MSNTIFISLQSHIFSEISVKWFMMKLFYFLITSNVDPWKDGILCHIAIAPSSYLVKPLQILIVRNKFINPLHRLLRIDIVVIGIFLHPHNILDDWNKHIYVFFLRGLFLLILSIEIEHYLLTIFCDDLKSIIRSIEPFFVDFADIL